MGGGIFVVPGGLIPTMAYKLIRMPAGVIKVALAIVWRKGKQRVDCINSRGL
jgi:hypothetical protein